MRTISFIFVLIFIMFFQISIAKSDEKMTATIGHVIQSTMQGTNVDIGKIMENELKNAAHTYAIESINILQKYLPAILDNVAAEMRQQADKTYKCELIKGVEKCK